MATHNFKYTTNTMAAAKCTKCGMLAFSPHPFPIEGCEEE